MMKVIDRKMNFVSSLLSISGYFFIGLIFFSGLISLVQLHILRLPLFIFEPVLLATFVLLMWHMGAKFKSLLSHYGILTLVAAIIIFLLLVLIAVSGPSNSTLIEAVSSGRPFLFAFFGVFCIQLVKKIPVFLMIAFCLGVLVGDYLNLLWAPLFREEWRGISAMNLMALFALNFLAARYSGLLLAFSMFLVSLYIAFLSGFRVNVIISVLGFSLGCLSILFSKKSKKEVFRFVALGATFPIAGLALFNFIRDHGRNFMDPYSYFRVVNRMEGLLHGSIEVSQDEDRKAVLRMYLNYDYNLLPRGFVMRALDMVGDFNDFPPLYFILNFGFFFGAVMVVALFFLGGRIFLKSLSSRATSPLEAVSAAFFVVFLFLFFVNGRFLYISQEAFLFGVLIGPWLNNTRPYRHDVS